MFLMVKGVCQIIGCVSGEDVFIGMNDLLDNLVFLVGLKEVGVCGLSFDLQFIFELMEKIVYVLVLVLEICIVLCYVGFFYDCGK